MSLTLLLRCTDIEETRQFYQDTLGFEVSSSAQDTITVALFNSTILFTTNDLWQREIGFSGTVYITVKDVNGYFNAIKEKVTLVWSITDMPYGAREFGIVDNNGYIIAFQQQR